MSINKELFLKELPFDNALLARIEKLVKLSTWLQTEGIEIKVRLSTLVKESERDVLLERFFRLEQFAAFLEDEMLRMKLEVQRLRESKKKKIKSKQ